MAGAGGVAVVAGELGGRAGAGDRVGDFGGPGENVSGVDGGAAGQGDIVVRAVLGAGDHGQAGVHGAALGGVVGDRVAELGIFVAGEQEGAVGPAPLAGARVGVQRPAHDQAVFGDGFDAEQVAVGQCPAGLPRLDGVVVAGADDQVAGAGPGAVGDGDGGAVLDEAEGDQVVADPAGQLAAQRVVRSHQQGVGAVGGQGHVGGRGGVHHLLRVPAIDPGVLVVLGQDGGVAVAKPEAGLLFPGGADPYRPGEPDVAQGAGEQGHAAAVFHRLQLAGVPGQDDLGAACLGVGDQAGQVRAGDHRGLIDDQQGARADGDRAAGAAPAGQVTQELGGDLLHRSDE